MDISLDKGQGFNRIQSYQDRVIKINQKDYSQPVAVGLEGLELQNSNDNFAALNLAKLKQLNINDYEVFLLGTGEELIFPEWDLLEQAQVLGTPIEVMTTGAACRTFTVLASEGRQVLALLYP